MDTARLSSGIEGAFILVRRLINVGATAFDGEFFFARVRRTREKHKNNKVEKQAGTLLESGKICRVLDRRSPILQEKKKKDPHARVRGTRVGGPKNPRIPGCPQAGPRAGVAPPPASLLFSGAGAARARPTNLQSAARHPGPRTRSPGLCSRVSLCVAAILLCLPLSPPK